MKVKNLLAVIIILPVLYIILMAIAELPPYGMADGPIHNEVSQRYINKGQEDTGVPNMVTSIVLDYRAYDTMFEAIVLFTATLAVVITLKSWKKGADNK